MICLDTNVVIGALNGDERLRGRLMRRKERLALPVAAYFELKVGVAKSKIRKTSAAKLDAFLEHPVIILEFDRADAAEAADIRATLETKGTPIGPYDVLIAAQARRRGATLVTANTREFERVPDLALEDWSA